MPELPEVETVVRTIRPYLIGRKILEIKTLHPKALLPGPGSLASPLTLSHLQQDELVTPLSGPPAISAGFPPTVLTVERRAKLIVLTLDTGCLAIHLKMTGRLVPVTTEPDDLKHVAAVIRLDNGTNLVFRDVRKFGRIFTYPDFATLSALYGFEPLQDDFTESALFTLLQSGKRQLKPFLLDQRAIAGIGNIYADEALWAAGLHPLRITNTVSAAESSALHHAIQSVLLKSIARNGTTFQSFYFGDDASGEFQDELAVFGKTGRACPRCGNAVTKTRVAQRGTHLCTQCQPLVRG